MRKVRSILISTNELLSGKAIVHIFFISETTVCIVVTTSSIRFENGVNILVLISVCICVFQCTVILSFILRVHCLDEVYIADVQFCIFCLIVLCTEALYFHV